MDPVRSAPFTPELLFDVLAEAAEILHRPGPLEPKYAWTVRALRVATGARVVGYVDTTAPEPAVRATAGMALARLQRDVANTFAPLIQRVTDSRRPTHRRSGEHALFAAPVPHGTGGIHGVLVGIADHDEPLEAVAWVAEGMGVHLGVALDNAATIAQLAELEAAQREVVTQLHEAVRPPVPEIEGADLGAHYLPADPGAPTGGDLYDWYVLKGGEVHAAVVDVAGKGIPATKHALAVTHALRLLVLEDCPLEELVTRADHLLAESDQRLVATVMVARYSPHDGRVRIAGGGHPPPLLASPDQGVELLEAGGIPIGYPDAGSFGVIERTLRRDESLILYTDGLIETSHDVIAGIHRLEAAAIEVARYPARFLARSIIDRSLEAAKRRDDVLALVIRHRSATQPRSAVLGPLRYRFSPTTASVPLARHFLADWLGYQPIDPAYRDDLLFVATELCTNGIRASSGEPESVELRARIEGDAVWIEVEDDGGGHEPDLTDEPPPPEGETGRGLFLVRALSDGLEIRREGDRTITAAVRRAAVFPEDSEDPPSAP